MASGSEEDALKECPQGSELRRARPPSKKKLEDEVEGLMVQIRQKETEIKSFGASSQISDSKNIRAEKEATIERRKKVDNDLRALNLAITQKMGGLSKLQSNLRYKAEDRHNEAIRKLEWNLRVQNFKISEEKKIVAEIDSLKRSKKSLDQYMTLKKEIDGMRDRQRRMREERDHYFKKVNELKHREDGARKKRFTDKTRTEILKKEIDELYEKKRSMVGEFHKQRQAFQDGQRRYRQESFKKREEERKAQQREIDDFESEKEPFEEDKLLCNMLFNYLQRFTQNSDSDITPAQTPTDENLPSIGVCGPAEELEDGAYVLLRKSDDLESEYIGTCRRPSRKNRRSRKQSMTKPITHTPEVISQFAALNLTAPSSAYEVTAAIEQLQGRKLYYEQRLRDHRSMDTDSFDFSFSGSSSCSSSMFSSSMRARADTWGFMGEPHPIAEENSQSEAGVSATESVVCEMSRQASKTESCESACDTRPNDHIMDELIAMSTTMCCRDNLEQPKCAFSSSPLSLSDSSDTPRDSLVDGNGYLCDCNNSDGTTTTTSCDSTPNHGQSSCDCCTPSQSLMRTDTQSNDNVCSTSTDKTDCKTQCCDRDTNNVIMETKTSLSSPHAATSVKLPDPHSAIAGPGTRDVVNQVSELTTGGDNPHVDCVKS
ncbi:uncharacterized protein LOC121377389 [Gigantopelta aegis]|uniref:uncharacterized protein LOC121377389 n=1 Tax=Gigantopelta aegis TaxID=1735272 RepID=UPI001B88DF13|nr:uncharacterized protein LOC121377389 [Gigantopelta aegis]